MASCRYELVYMQTGFPFINTCVSLYAVFQIVLGSSYVNVMQLRSFYEQSHILPMPLIWFCNCRVNSSHVTWQWLHAGNVMHTWCACMRCNDCVCCFGLRNTVSHPIASEWKSQASYNVCATAPHAVHNMRFDNASHMYIYIYIWITQENKDTSNQPRDI